MTPHEALLLELEAERVTHTRESFVEVNRRLVGERPETPHQVLVRREHERRVRAAWRSVREVGRP